MDTYIHACIHRYTYTHTHTHIYTCTYTYIYIFITRCGVAARRASWTGTWKGLLINTNPSSAKTRLSLIAGGDDGGWGCALHLAERHGLRMRLQIRNQQVRDSTCWTGVHIFLCKCGGWFFVWSFVVLFLSCRVFCGVVLVVCLCVWPVSLLTYSCGTATPIRITYSAYSILYMTWTRTYVRLVCSQTGCISRADPTC